MKITLISVGLLATTISQASPAFARGGLHLLDPPLNPQHINGLPAEVRDAVAHMCRSAQANTNLLAILRTCESLFCISNTSAAVTGMPVAHGLAAYIRFMSRQAAIIVCRKLITQVIK
jgi:hypothetical protein